MNVPLFKVFMAEDAGDCVAKILKSGYIGQGQKVEEFEEKLRSFLRTPFVNTVNSGTSALHLALHSVKNICGDRNEVLTTPVTCTATNFPILANNFKIRWVDIDLGTGNIDLTDLQRKVNNKTAAIMVVHWGGYPCDLQKLRSIQKYCENTWGYSPPIIEDCAHAFGSTFQRLAIGAWGNYCAFSFQAIKHLTCGDGGALVSPSSEIHRLTKLVRWYGLDRESSADFRCAQNVQHWGYKFHMNDISATIGLANFPHVANIIETHRANGKFYNHALANIDGVSLLKYEKDRESSYWIYTIRVQNRKEFIRKMAQCGIAVSQVHDRNDKHQCLQEFRSALPNTDEFCSDMICIPCGWWVSKEDREYIVDCIKKGW